MIDKENILRKEIIGIGKKLYDLRLAVATAGNLSARLDNNNILITKTGAALGELAEGDVIKIDLNKDITDKKVSTEFPLHKLIYKNFPVRTIIHCHPPLINGYFAAYSDLKVLTFESKLYLGNIPVIEQDTPSITKPELVIEALKTNNLVVIKHHGVVCAGESFKAVLDLVEMLEEAVKIAAVARLFKKEILDGLDKTLKESLMERNINYPMFSAEHIRAIVDLVNKDEFISQKGKELDLTVKLAIKLDETGEIYRFNFEKGKIIQVDTTADAPFVISAPRQVWEQVFLGKLDSFVAVTQGKMKLQGQLGQLSKWYVPFTRLFELFKQVPIK